MTPADLKKKLTPRRMLWVGLPSLAVLVLVALGMGRKKDPTFFTARVEKGDVMAIVQATGTINAVTSVLVGSQVSGTIEKLYVDFNSRVDKGQKIAQLEPSLFSRGPHLHDRLQERGVIQGSGLDVDDAVERSRLMVDARAAL